VTLLSQMRSSICEHFVTNDRVTLFSQDTSVDLTLLSQMIGDTFGHRCGRPMCDTFVTEHAGSIVSLCHEMICEHFVTDAVVDMRHFCHE